MSLLSKWSKSPLWPVLLSALVMPGLGQIYNRDIKRGLLLLVVFMGSMFWFSAVTTEQLSTFLHSNPETWAQNPDILREAVNKVVNQNPNMYLIFFLLMSITWIFAVVDAYFSSRKFRKPPLPLDETPHSLS